MLLEGAEPAWSEAPHRELFGRFLGAELHLIEDLAVEQLAELVRKVADCPPGFVVDRDFAPHAALVQELAGSEASSLLAAAISLLRGELDPSSFEAQYLEADHARLIQQQEGRALLSRLRQGRIRTFGDVGKQTTRALRGSALVQEIGRMLTRLPRPVRDQAFGIVLQALRQGNTAERRAAVLASSRIVHEVETDQRRQLLDRLLESVQDDAENIEVRRDVIQLLASLFPLMEDRDARMILTVL
jgi:hypothetical protein